MSNLYFINKENATVNHRSLKEKSNTQNNSNNGIKKISLKDGFGTPEGAENSYKSKSNLKISKDSLVKGQKNLFNSLNTQRVPLGGKPLNQSILNANKNPNDQNNAQGFAKKKTIKRSSSLLLPDHDIKKKIQVQKDEDLSTISSQSKESSNASSRPSPLRRRKVKTKVAPVVGNLSGPSNITKKLLQKAKESSIKQELKRQKLSDDEFEIEFVPKVPDPLPYEPDNCPPLSQSDLEFFRTKNPIPQKSSSLKEINEELNQRMNFDEIPEIALKIYQSDDEQEKESFNDSLVKKQPKLLNNCDVKLDNQHIPDLHFDAGDAHGLVGSESLFRSPSKRTYSEASADNDDYDEGLSHADLESLIM